MNVPSRMNDSSAEEWISGLLCLHIHLDISKSQHTKRPAGLDILSDRQWMVEAHSKAVDVLPESNERRYFIYLITCKRNVCCLVMNFCNRLFPEENGGRSPNRWHVQDLYTLCLTRFESSAFIPELVCVEHFNLDINTTCILTSSVYSIQFWMTLFTHRHSWN